MPTDLENTLILFVAHNFPLVIFGGLSILFSFLAVLHPSRTNTLFLIGFLILTFNFEYNKHLFLKIRTDMLDSIFPEGTRFTKYALMKIFLESAVPVFMGVAGWAFVVIGTISALKKRHQTTSRL